MNDIVIYVDEGVSGLSLRHAVKSLQQEVDLNVHSLKRLDAKALKSQSWMDKTALLVFPGGRDVYYQKALSEEGTEKIKRFVHQGGSYLGICAGAYFASAEIEFEKGNRFEVCEKRSLKFFPGLAKGPALGLNKYSPDSEQGAEAALISWTLENKHHCFTYYNGGCSFESPHRFAEVSVLAHYTDLEEKPAAIVLCKHGLGKAVLSGVHVEYSGLHLSMDHPQMDRIVSLLQKAEGERRQLFRNVLDQLSIRLKS